MQNQSLEQIYLGRSVLVTGGLGFIGSNLCIRLAELGAQVSVIDRNLPNGGANDFNLDPIRDRIQIQKGDMGDSDLAQTCVPDKDYIFNLAGTLSHTDSMRDPAADLHANCGAHIPLLDACRDLNPKVRILYAGTRAQYGRPQTNPVNEDHPLVSADTNGINKTAGEAYHLLYARHYGLKACSLRLTNTYGPRHQMKHHRQGVLNWFVRQVLDGNPVQVFGDGTQLRDINYVDDVVDAMLYTLANDRAIGDYFNLGGHPISLKDLAELLVDLNGSGQVKIQPYTEDSKKVEIGDYVADTSKIQEAIHWKAAIQPREGFRRTLEYYREHRSQYW